MCIFGLYYHAISTIGKYEEALQNKYTCAPNLIELRAGPGIEIYMGRNMNSSAKQIQSSVSPNLIVGLSPSLTLRAFLRRLLWNKVKKCCTTAIYTHTGGLIRFYLVIWSVLSQFKWPLLFLHHRGRGRGTRLSIRSQDPNNSSDTERGPCLSRPQVILSHFEECALCCRESGVPLFCPSPLLHSSLCHRHGVGPGANNF